MNIWTKLALGGLAGLAALQFVTVDRINPTVTADIQAPHDVKAILRRACFDCHSNETRWAWYSYVAPASWLVHRDVMKGRKALNFSEWEYLPAARRAHFMRETAEEVANSEMAPWFYLVVHPHARLSRADTVAITSWVGSASPTLSGDGHARAQ